MSDVAAIPDALRQVLRDYCHMEWYETHELRGEITGSSTPPKRRELFEAFRTQLDDAISRGYISPDQFLAMTADDCESNGEVVERLKTIRNEVFGA
jgi:hypothetical protein